jgi:hypothetical protein
MLESLHNLGSPAQDILGWRQLSSIAEVPESFAERILEAFEDEHLCMESTMVTYGMLRGRHITPTGNFGY